MMPMPPNLKARVQKALLESPQLAQSFMRRAGRAITEVLCPICRNPLVGLVEDPSREERRRVGRQTVITKVMVPSPLASYDEIKLRFDDGSAHVMAMCRSCALKLLPEDLEPLYMADMEEFARSEAAGRGIPPWNVFEKRKPVSFEILGS